MEGNEEVEYGIKIMRECLDKSLQKFKSDKELKFKKLIVAMTASKPMAKGTHYHQFSLECTLISTEDQDGDCAFLPRSMPDDNILVEDEKTIDNLVNADLAKEHANEEIIEEANEEIIEEAEREKRM